MNDVICPHCGGTIPAEDMDDDVQTMSGSAISTQCDHCLRYVDVEVEFTPQFTVVEGQA